MSAPTVKILVIELFDHSEVVYNICSLLHEDKRIQLSVICKLYVVEGAAHYKFEGVEFIPLGKKEHIEQQLREYKAEIQSADLIVWSTLPLSCKWIERSYSGFPQLIILHNLRSWIHPYSFLDWDKAYHPLFWARLMRTIWLRRSQKNLLKSCKAVLVLGEPLLDYLKIYADSLSKKACLLPLSKCAGAHHLRERSGTVQVVIPGSLIAGKGYELLADSFKAATPGFEQAVELTLLGRVRNINLLRRFLALESENVKVSYSTDWVTPDIFSGQLKEANFLVLPYGEYAGFGIVREKWGATKASGAVRDAVLHGKPALISCNYYHPPDNCRVYKDSDSLSRYLISWINDGPPDLTRENAVDRSGFNDYLYAMASSGKTIL